jgi:hypothetical protein
MVLEAPPRWIRTKAGDVLGMWRAAFYDLSRKGVYKNSGLTDGISGSRYLHGLDFGESPREAPIAKYELQPLEFE